MTDISTDLTSAEQLAITTYIKARLDLGDDDGEILADVINKAWKTEDEAKHPRDRFGRFISAKEISAAKRSPLKAAELRERVKPTDRHKLETALKPKDTRSQSQRLDEDMPDKSEPDRSHGREQSLEEMETGDPDFHFRHDHRAQFRDSLSEPYSDDRRLSDEKRYPVPTEQPVPPGSPAKPVKPLPDILHALAKVADNPAALHALASTADHLAMHDAITDVWRGKWGAEADKALTAAIGNWDAHGGQTVPKYEEMARQLRAAGFGEETKAGAGGVPGKPVVNHEHAVRAIANTHDSIRRLLKSDRADKHVRIAKLIEGHTVAELKILRDRLGLAVLTGRKAQIIAVIATKAAGREDAESLADVTPKPRMSVDDAESHIKSLFAAGGLKDYDTRMQLADTIKNRLTAKDIHELKDRLGLSASGNKSELASRIASRARDLSARHALAEKKKDRAERAKKFGKKRNDTLFQAVKSSGGINPNDHAFKAHFENMSEAMEYGVPLGIFNKSAKTGLDILAREMWSGGYFSADDEHHAIEMLLNGLAQKAHSHHADLSEQYDKQYEEYLKEKSHAEQGSDRSEVEAALRSGEEAGRDEAQDDPLGQGEGGVGEGGGESSEGEGDQWDDGSDAGVGDDSFDFGGPHSIDFDEAESHASADHSASPPSPPTQSDPETGLASHSTPHHAALAAIAPGESGYASGHFVRRSKDGTYQVETPRGYTSGTADDIASHVGRAWENQKPESGDVKRAMARVDGHSPADPFMDAKGADADAEARGRQVVPHGARGVSLDPNTHGRVGSVVRDEETGKSHLLLDGGQETKASDYEPLDAGHSWRGGKVAGEAKVAKPVTKPLFDESAGGEAGDSSSRQPAKPATDHYVSGGLPYRGRGELAEDRLTADHLPAIHQRIAELDDSIAEAKRGATTHANPFDAGYAATRAEEMEGQRERLAGAVERLSGPTTEVVKVSQPHEMTREEFDHRLTASRDWQQHRTPSDIANESFGTFRNEWAHRFKPVAAGYIPGDKKGSSKMTAFLNAERELSTLQHYANDANDPEMTSHESYQGLDDRIQNVLTATGKVSANALDAIRPEVERLASVFRREEKAGTLTAESHRHAVASALAAGHPVPAHVLADYPELVEKQEAVIPVDAPHPVSSPAWDTEHEVTGNAYPHRDEIARLGGRWSGSRKKWTVPGRSVGQLPGGLGSTPVSGRYKFPLPQQTVSPVSPTAASPEPDAWDEPAPLPPPKSLADHLADVHAERASEITAWESKLAAAHTELARKGKTQAEKSRAETAVKRAQNEINVRRNPHLAEAEAKSRVAKEKPYRPPTLEEQLHGHVWGNYQYADANADYRAGQAHEEGLKKQLAALPVGSALRVKYGEVAGVPVAESSAVAPVVPSPTPDAWDEPVAGSAVSPTLHHPRDHAADYAKNGTRAKAFKGWFGDWETEPHNASKVVKSGTGEPQESHELPATTSETHDGKPLVVYHGTAHGGYKSFDKKKVDPDGLYGPGFYFTEDRGVAEEYMSGGNSSVYNNIHVPQENRKAMVDAFTDAAKEHGFQLDDPDSSWSWAKSRDMFLKHGLLSYLGGGVINAGRMKTAVRMGPQFGAVSVAKRGKDKGAEAPLETKEVFLNIRKPYDVDKPILFSDAPRELKDAVEKEYGKGQPSNEPISYNMLVTMFGGKKKANKFLASAGYDGITHVGGDLMGSGHHHRVWIAFEPHQIKAVDNEGAFDADKHDIHKAAK